MTRRREQPGWQEPPAVIFGESPTRQRQRGQADCSKIRCFSHSQGLARRKNNLPVGGVMVMLLVPFAVEMV